MNDFNPQNNLPDPSQQPAAQPLMQGSDSSYISSSQPKITLQPSAELVQEVRAEPAEKAAAMASRAQTSTPGPTPLDGQVASTQSASTPPPQIAGVAPATPAAAPQPTRPDPSSIYPEATKGINSNATSLSTSTNADDVRNAEIASAFDEGYETGRTIFFYELIVGLVLEFLSNRVELTFHTPLVLAVLYVVDYLILLYLPYRVLRAEGVEEPLWVTLIGTAIQTVVMAAGLVLLAVVSKAMGGLSILGAAIGVIAFIVVSYYLTKLSWGMAFSFVSRIKNKALVRVIGIVLAIVFMGVIAYHFALQHTTGANTTSNVSAPSTHSGQLSNYHVQGNPAFSVNFYKGSKTFSGVNGTGDLTYTTGHANQSVSISIANSASKIPNSSCSNLKATNTQFNFQAQGSTGIVCVSRTSYIGYIQISGKNYIINMFSFSYPQNETTVKAIFNSITIE
jgi:hypothetical protein